MLIERYNGAWWYVHTYVFMLLIPPEIFLRPVKKLDPRVGIVACFAWQIGWFALERFVLPDQIDMPALSYLWTEATNLMRVVPYVWSGAFLCKMKAVKVAGEWCNMHVRAQRRRILPALTGIALFVGYNLVHVSALSGIAAVAVFLWFNTWEKSERVKKAFYFLGRHSTNIWLTHMFFYNVLFEGLVTSLKLPVLMLAYMLILCIMTSYIIMWIEKGVYVLLRGRKEAKETHNF